MDFERHEGAFGLERVRAAEVVGRPDVGADRRFFPVHIALETCSKIEFADVDKVVADTRIEQHVPAFAESPPRRRADVHMIRGIGPDKAEDAALRRVESPVNAEQQLAVPEFPDLDANAGAYAEPEIVERAASQGFEVCQRRPGDGTEPDFETSELWWPVCHFFRGRRADGKYCDYQPAERTCMPGYS